MYFLTRGYSNWEGYEVINDPTVVLMVSKGLDLNQEYPVDNLEDSPSDDPNDPTGPDGPTDPDESPPPGSGDLPLAITAVGIIAALVVLGR
jgi:hypothetical protein